MDRNKVVLVDEHDQTIGEMDKLLAHEQGLLHRAFSVFIFNAQGELLLQQRADSKYHGGGLWTNTCCSHPQLDEDIHCAALERLEYEMGIRCELRHLYSFVYNEPVENYLIEHELDHIFIGHSNQTPTPHPLEVQDYKWMRPAAIIIDLLEHPRRYTVWFRQAFSELVLKSVIKI
ncbi:MULTISPECIES: isopentenyl-diphosphate Delta-isomerase [Sphingobacterium]|uniref:isopentenyl-diphosphate Delta-isomerase n=1 Tax=Sphingobacterium TaxID=28453 RepID=UPI0013DAB028|nr:MULTISPECIES: isopentenyl-diphosphate Delta-isomerase [unclassified Sphingobacterium]